MKQNKLNILLILMIFVLSLVPQGVTAEEQRNSDSGVLFAMDIVPADLDTEQKITRGEMVKYIYALANFDVYAEKDYFCDIQDSEYRTYINDSCERGLTSQSSNNQFRPGDTITFNEAVKLLVSVLGYDIKAKYMGGYPSGYLKAAKEIDLLSGVYTTDNAVTGSIMLSLFINALETPVFAETGIYSDRTDYYPGEPLLYVAYQMEKVSGVVKANSRTSLAKAGGVGKNQIKIDTATYQAGETDAEEFLGRYVTAYCKVDKSSDIREIKYITAGRKNVEKKISSGLIDKRSTLNTIYYYENSQTERYKMLSLISAPYVIYNGVAAREIQNELLFPLCGDVTVIDYNDDGKYEVVIINSYVTYFVDTVSESQNMITDKMDMPVLNLNNDNLDIVIKKGSEKTSFSEISHNDILMVAADREKKINGVTVPDVDNAEFIDILVIRKSIGGIVDTLGEGELFIDGQRFEMSQSFQKAVSEGRTSVKAGGAGTFYFNAYDQLAGIDTGLDTNWQYGFIIAGQREKNSLNNKIELKILCESGKTKVFCIEKSIKIDGLAVKDIETVYRQLFTEGTVNNMLIKYRLKSDDGQLREIDTEYYNRAVEDKDSLRLDYDVKSGSKVYYSSYGRNFGRVARATENAKVFVVPPDGQAAEIADKYLSVGTPGVFGSDGNFNVQLYNIGDDKTSSVIVWYNDKLTERSEVSWSSPLGIVEKVTKGLNSEGIETPALYIYETSKQQTHTYFVADDDVLKDIDLNPGDVVLFELDSYNNITNLNRTVSYQDLRMELDQYLSAGTVPPSFRQVTGSQDYEQYFGQVYSKGNEGFALAFDKPMTEDMAVADTIAVGSGGNIIVYDEERERAFVGTMEDIIGYKDTKDLGLSTILYVRKNISFAKDIILYKLK